MPESPILTRDEREAKIGAATAWIKTCSIESAGRECPQPVDHEAFYSRMVQCAHFLSHCKTRLSAEKLWRYRKNSGGNDPIVPYAIHVDSAPPLSDIGMWAETDLPVSHGPNRPKIKVKIASSGLLLMRLIERIKQETMRDEIDLQTRRDDRLRNTLHRDRRSEQVRLLRLLVEGLVVAQSHNVAISERILPTTLSRGLTDPDTLLMHADLYKGKSILNNQLASDEARWQMKIEGREHDLARLQQLGRKNLASFRFVRRWVRSSFVIDIFPLVAFKADTLSGSQLKLTAFMPIIEQAIFVQRRKRAARDSVSPKILSL